MEMSIVVNHQRRRNLVSAPNGYESDHIIPYCISMDNSRENLQFLKKSIHLRKSVIDRKIIKQFRNKGWIEKITHYSVELKKSMEFLRKEYLKEYEKLNINEGDV